MEFRKKNTNRASNYFIRKYCEFSLFKKVKKHDFNKQNTCELFLIVLIKINKIIRIIFKPT